MAATCRNNPRRAPARATLARLPIEAIGVIALCVAPLTLAATLSKQEPLRHSADAVTVDFRSDTLNLTGNVRVTQGEMSIEAQSASGVGVAADNSRWTFEKSVHVRTPEAQLQADTAVATIANGQIAKAHIEGSPARFEQRAGTGASERPVQGRAGTIDYDFTNGVVRLSNDVWFSNGKDEFRGDIVIYDMRDQRVQINPAGESRGRVRGIIRPEKKPGSASGAAGTGSPPAGTTESGTTPPAEPTPQPDPQPQSATERGA